MGVCGSGKTTVAKGISTGPGLGVRRGRRLPLRRPTSRRCAPGSRSPTRTAGPGCEPSATGSASTRGPASPSSSPARRCKRGLPRPALRRDPSRVVRPREAPSRADPGAMEHRHRPLHAGLAARQPARHPRAARRTTSPALASPARAPPPRSRPTCSPRSDCRAAGMHLDRTPAGTVMTLLAAADGRQGPYAGDAQLVAGRLLGIAAVVAAHHLVKLHPFLALMLGSAVLGAVGGHAPPPTSSTSFIAGFGSTAGSVGVLIALGAMIGKMLEDSGGANRIVVDARRPGRAGRAAVDDGRHRGDPRHPALLRGRRRAARARRHPRGPAGPGCR